MLTALAAVVRNAQGASIPGTVVSIETASHNPMNGVTNADGYVLFPLFDAPSAATVRLSGAAAAYEQAVNVTQPNTTLRIGGGDGAPQDIQLPAAVPFV